MNFPEAINTKEKTLPETYMGLKWDIFIVPEKSEDFNKYILSAPDLFIHRKLTDNHAKLFSSNDSYTIRGFCYKEGSVLHRSIDINT